MMKKTLLFLMFSVLCFAQRTELIRLNQSIKDRNGLARSLTLIDNRADKIIGTIADKKETAEIKFEAEDLKTYFENRFLEDNKKLGNMDVVLMLEELKIYDEQDENKQYPYAKAKIKMSTFLKRSDRYYFINRFSNVIVCDPKRTAHAQRFLATVISDIMTELIKNSYSGVVSGSFIPENEINNYDEYLRNNFKVFLNPELKDGVYTNFKEFLNQRPNSGYSIEKNKKGKVVRLMKGDLQAPLSDMYCYVEEGKVYKLTPVGFEVLQKDAIGFYMYTSRANLFAEAKTGGVFIGAVAGGIVGALIGAAIESGSNSNAGAMHGIGFKSNLESNVYIDSLTGAYVFEK
ncbi:hypothetical protein JET18_12070 [Chryseobacterium sp. L7]|uniref:Glycine zipper family protein n=1 Tax=Chryseobacterium endalhagicum TaxID=2797638 RepID=A0ABS1QI59_9FLAO|nr:hypothetical protein [Chryseobacterium endalhagicum]MBL1221578.1 hypothetical protein [Chryseobacterium endalhagicum]